MRQTLTALTMAITLLGGLSFASAAIEVNDDIQINVWNRGQSQGPFQVTIYDDHTPGIGSKTIVETPSPFLTFCVETHEYFNNVDTFNINGFNNYTTNSNKLLTGYSAWVYEKFLDLSINVTDSTQTLTNLFSAYGVSTKNALNAFQDAIWAGVITKEAAINASNVGSKNNSEYGAQYGKDYNLENSTLVALGINLTAFQNDSQWHGASYAEKLANVGDVLVINIHTGSNMGQDQLIQIITNGHQNDPVPEPAGFVIWSLLAGVCWLGARRVKAARR